MGKSSSSSKRKRPKDSSKVQTKKKSKIKKSGLKKKLRRRDDSDSYFSDDSGRSVSISSSSEESYRRRRSQSRTHKAVKESKRRARSLSSSSEESHRMRKRKRSRRNDDSVMKKKNFRSKKKTKKDREASISSRSRGPCCSSHSSSSESEHESRRGRSGRKEKRIRKLKNVNSEAARRRYRSRSCSPCSINDESSDHSSKEKVIDGNTSKRLKSVIIVTKDDEDEEERELYMNEDKEQTICDHDDYPSSRSNDSVDGDDRAISKPASVGTVNNDSTEGKSSKISEAADNVDANDLESILRQKALENLKRFRGKSNDDTLKSLSTKKAEVNQIASINDDGRPAAKGDSAHLLRKEENDFERNSGGNDSVSSANDIPVTDEMAVVSRENINMNLNPVSNRPRLVRSALKQALLNATTTKIKSLASLETSKPKLMTESSISEHDATLLQGDDYNEDANNASGFGSSVNSSRLTSAVIDMNKLQDEGQLGSQLQKLVSSPTTPSSTTNEFTVNTTADSTSAEQSSSASKNQDDDKEGSQLEQKTMSVMRGGEMVQVSYKVYVPKKAPGLARRQLKR
ncbi:uncharacterized protein LOC126669539 [Mercurialis annua]|uniref:uncharacterized protein LOC126669539 n=1 Tax=Mercurialis annua TaxID=3986 RepID=UPI00215E2DFD|nr:uncharacterized protein LOC126669539 [Mercurialis annua]